MKCQLCGMEIYEGGVRSHRGSRICVIRRRAFILEKRGLVGADGHHDRPPKMLASVCGAAGIDYEVAPSHYSSGITYYSTFVPAWVAAVCKLTRTACPGVGKRWDWFDQVFDALRADPALRDAILAAEQVSTEMVLTLLTQQGIIQPA